MTSRHGSGQDLGFFGEELPDWVGFFVPFAVFIGLLQLGLVLLRVIAPAPGTVHDVWAFWVIPFIAFSFAALVFELDLITTFINSGRWKLLRLTASKQDFRLLGYRDFERLVGATYEKAGFRVEYADEGADGGYDLVLHRGSERVLVQCKQRAWTGVADVRQLFGVLTAERAGRAVLVGSGVFSLEARQFAQGKTIELVDGTRLVEMLEEAHATTHGS